jgi:hypothetical protein
MVDTGASSHITNHFSFTSYTSFPSPKLLYQGSGATVNALGKGTVTLNVLVNGQVQPWELTEVYYVPDFKVNVLSPVLLRKSARMTLFDDKIEFTSPSSSKLLATAKLYSGNIYLLQLSSFPSTTAYSWEPHPSWNPPPSNFKFPPFSNFRRRRLNFFRSVRQSITSPSSVLWSR